MSVLRFSEPGCREVDAAGGKGASLARMAELGLPVPPGFVVAASALADSLPDGGEELRRLLAEGASAEAAESARALVLDAEPAAELGAAVEARTPSWARQCPWRCARAPAPRTPRPPATRASRRPICTCAAPQDVMSRVRDCWASFFSERALFYRERKGSLEDIAMAVVVQRMVAADVAGVLFTVDPVRRRRDRMIVEAVFGLGESAVSGQVTPDHFVLSREGEVKKEQLAVQPFAVVSAPDGGTAERELSSEEGRRAHARRRDAAGAGRPRRRARGAARGAAGHRVGARGRRALRAPGAARDDMSDLVERARAWMEEVHPHYPHMERTLHWADWLDPGASEAVRIAAVTHDAERAYPDRRSAGTRPSPGTTPTTTAGTRTAVPRSSPAGCASREPTRR